MFSEFRQEVILTLSQTMPEAPLWPEIPEDVAEVPCIVVGRSGGRESAQAVVFDLDLIVWVIGRRQKAGGAEDELDLLTDQVFDALGGTKGTKSPNGTVIAATRVDPRVVNIAGQECPASAVAVVASAVTC